MAKQSGDRTHSHAFLETTCELVLKGEGLAVSCPPLSAPGIPPSCAESPGGGRAAVGAGRLSKAFPLSGCTNAQPGTKPGPLSQPPQWPLAWLLANTWPCPPAVHAGLGVGQAWCGLRHPSPTSGGLSQASRGQAGAGA